MKAITLIVMLGVLLATTNVLARDVYVHGYTRSDGTYVQPYYRTAPDHNIYNNYSTQGNINPYTGRVGTVNPYAQPSAPVGIQPIEPIRIQPIEPIGIQPIR